MTFIANPNFIRELAASPGAKAALRRGAESARPHVEGFTHHAMPHRDHSRPIEVEEAGGDVYLVNTNWGAHLEEWGGADVRSPVYSPLRRGVRAAGFRLIAED